jgi:cation:H+ antiporter
MAYIQLLVGFLILLYCGKFLVKGGSSLASSFKISKLVVGLTVVSLGTSAPELLVSLQAALSGHPDIAIGNVIGSNISNIALVLGISAIVLPIPVKKTSIVLDWPIMLIASILFFLFIRNNQLQLFEGLIFTSGLALYILFTLYKSRKENKNSEEFEKPQYTVGMSLVLIAISSIGLVLGSKWLVSGASEIARTFGVTERVISLSIIAFGTSVPELATSVTAAFKKETDISIGNIIGSNIFNILGILGVTSIVKTIPANISIYRTDIFWMIGISVLLFLFILPVKRGKLKRWEGMVLVLVYITYVYIIISNS